MIKFWHDIQLPDGSWTNGQAQHGPRNGSWPDTRYGLPRDLGGKHVLDIGAYDGFFGPATGTFWAMAFVLFLGFNLTRATAYTKVMNFTSNLVSLVFFLAGGFVSLPEGIVMGLGQFAGARIGSRLVITRGSRFIRPVFIAVVVAISAKLLWQNFR